MFDFLFNLDTHRDKRRYSKRKTKDISLVLKAEIKRIEEDLDYCILEVLNKNAEHIIVYRSKLDEDELGLIFIHLKIIHKKGVVINSIKLSANKRSNNTLVIGDIEVFGENIGRGYGSILLKALTDFAQKHSISAIEGWISRVDENHFDKLNYFYQKHGFDVNWTQNNASIKVADVTWTNYLLNKDG